MSRFSGKCDVYDWFGMIACRPDETPFECFKRRNARIYLTPGSNYPITIEKPSDLVPFYPFISSSLSSSEYGGDIIVLSHDHITYMTGIIRSSSIMEYRRELLEEYDRVVKEEDPKYVYSS